ncbi:hypothetical protein ADK82_11270 [Streptomyces sp. NRRL S-4]|nr:hypothetical protein ADK82_11270 [Streptomyces sp. NRRL S-4]
MAARIGRSGLRRDLGEFVSFEEEWAELRAAAVQRSAMQINSVPAESGGGGDLVVNRDDLGAIGNDAYGLRVRLSKEGDGHMNFSDTEDGEGRGIARKFLSVLGQHPDAYASVSAAEQLYTSSVLEAQVNADGDIDTGDARRAVRIGSGAQGILDQARADQIEATNLKTHEDYEKAAEKRAGWVEFGSTAALGAGVATAAFFLPAAPVIGVGALLVPIFTDTATGAVEQVMGDVLGGMGEKVIDESKEKMDDLTDTEKYAVYTAGEVYTETLVEDFESRHKEEIDKLDARTKDSLVEDLHVSRLVGYQDGNLRARVQGAGPEA